MYDLIIIGGGPAGLTASIYAIRKHLNVSTITMDLGGKTNYSLNLPWIQEYRVIRGSELVSKFKQELGYLDFAHVLDKVTHLEKASRGFIVKTSGGKSFETKSVILANGVAQSNLGIPGEKEFRGKGICYSAVSYAPLFYDKVTTVFGEGDLALRSAAELTTVAKTVHLVGPNQDTLDSDLGRNLRGSPKVEMFHNYQIKKIVGEEFVNSVVLEGPDGEIKELTTDCVFVEKELIPNTSFVEGLVDLDEKGRIVINSINQTSMPGIFAAGDITNIYAEQVLVAIGEGAKAALSAYDYLLRMSN